VLRDAAGQVVHEGGIYRRQAEIVAHDGKSFLVGVVQVNHEPMEADSLYAKFVVGEVRLDIVP
jgi:hypothetical protein